MNEDLNIRQKIAIEGEVAYMLSSATHKEEMLYNMYLMLHNVKPIYRPFYIRAMKEALDESDRFEVDRISMQLELGEVPTFLWINRTKADIKHFLNSSDFAVGIAPWLPLNTKVVKEQILKSAFFRFLKKSFVVCPLSTKMLCDNIIEECEHNNCKELELVKDMCFIMAQSFIEFEPILKKLNLDDIEPNDEVLNVSLNTKELLYFDVETEADIEEMKHNRRNRIKRSFKKNKLTDYEKKVLFGEEDKTEPYTEEYEETVKKLRKDFISNNPNFLTQPEDILNQLDTLIEHTFEKKNSQEPNKVKKKYKYRVLKKFKSTGATSVLKTFNSEREAKEFIKSVLDKYPDIIESCELILLKLQY